MVLGGYDREDLELLYSLQERLGTDADRIDELVGSLRTDYAILAREAGKLAGDEAMSDLAEKFGDPALAEMIVHLCEGILPNLSQEVRGHKALLQFALRRILEGE